MPNGKASNLVKDIKVLDAIYLAAEAWENVTQSTIANCFEFAFKGERYLRALSDVPVPHEMTPSEFEGQVDMPQDFFQNDEELADETMEADDQTEIDDGNKEDVTTNEFMTSLQTVRDFLQKTGASQEIFHSITKMERIGTALKIERQSQSRITDFFSK